MKNMKKHVIKIDDIQYFDDVKIAGVMYRVDIIEQIGNHYLLQLHNVRRPSIEAHLTLERNTLMNVWRYKK